MIKAGIIGSGIGLKHLSAINNYRGSKVLCILEKNKKRAKQLKRKLDPKITILTDENLFFAYNDLNLISIASYDEDHFRQIIKSIRKNCHIIVEKPVCLNQKHLNRIRTELKKKPNIKFIANLVLRENTLFKEIKKMINLKKIYHIDAAYLWGRKEKLLEWRSKTKEYSLTLGALIHILDLVCWMLNSKPTFVYAKTNNKLTKNTKFKKFSFCSYIFTFPNDVLVNLKADGVCDHPHFHDFKIFQKGKSFISNINGQVEIKKIGIDRYKQIKKNYQYPDKKNRKNIITKFIDSILDKSNTIMSKKYLFNLMTACFSADLSAKTNKEIKIRYLK